MTYSRKLVSIMFTDIVGYTKLMQQSESAALEVRQRHRSAIESTHKEFGGKVIQYHGDGTLSIFESAADSVLCAIRLQEMLQQDSSIPLRIGIHLGDVMMTESDIIGNSVNIASRVESLGCAGAILISNKVREEITNQEIPSKWLGTYHFKNDEVPRDIYAIAKNTLYIPSPEDLSGKLEIPDRNSDSITSKDASLESSLKEIILAHLSDTNFSVTTLCKEVGYSRPQLYRKLQAIKGMSPSDYIREIRLQKAAELLRNQAGNVSEIAFKTGFNNLSYFSKVFQERFGNSPSEFSKNQNKTTTSSAALTQLVGRQEEIGEIFNIIEETRLLTLTGPGGTGKTRLALELMHRIGPLFKDGVHFIQLAPVVDYQQVPPKIAQVLKLQQDPTKDTMDLIIESINLQETLLILDNFEHVLEGAEYVSALLLECPNLKIISTSRTVLNILGEQEYSVPQLALPDTGRTYTLEELGHVHSIQLFLDRVKNVKPTFQFSDENKDAIEQICIGLDGLPLALELAAARIKIFSPEALLRRLNNNLDILKSNAPKQPDRHRTLRNAIDWSYGLLAPEEKTLFRRLSIFSGGCTIDAAEEICFEEYLPNFDIIDVLVSLVDKSLLQRGDQEDGEPRFFMLETLKTFGQDKLEKSLEKEQIARQYAAYYTELLEDSDRHLTGPEQKDWLNQIDIELDNIRAVMTWFEKQGKSYEGLSFAVSFWRFWAIRTMMREGSDWFQRMLEIPCEETASIIRCKALNAYGVLFGLTQRVLNALSIFEQSLEMARSLKYEEGIAQALKYVSWIHYFQCNFATYEKHASEALALHKRLGNTRDIASIYNNSGNKLRLEANLSEALIMHENAANLMKDLGDMRGYAYNLCGLAWLYCFLGDHIKSTNTAETAVEILNKIDDKQLIAFGNTILAFNYCYLKKYEQAVDLVELAIPLWQKSGNKYGNVMCDIVRGMAFLKTGKYDEFDIIFSKYNEGLIETIDKTFQFWEKQLRSKWLQLTGSIENARLLTSKNLKNLLDSGIKLVLPDELELMASIYSKSGDNDPAVQLFSYAQKLRADYQMPVPPIWKEEHDELMLAIRKGHSDVDFENNWKKGQDYSEKNIKDLVSTIK